MDAEKIAERFNLNDTAKDAVKLGFSNLTKHQGHPDWGPAQFAANLANWLVAEHLLPVNLEPETFREAIIREIQQSQEKA